MDHDTRESLMRMVWSWLLIGVSQMSPLQVAQAVAAVAATIYTVLQTCVLISTWLEKRRRE